MNPLVSVIIPIYDVEKYLRKCVDSILGQTYKDLEVILVDDGSPDYSPSICDDYEKQDPRIIVVHQKNGGLSDARNAGIEKAAGKYVLFIDSDDYVELNMIENAVKTAEEYDADVVVWGYYSDFVDVSGKLLKSYIHQCPSGTYQRAELKSIKITDQLVGMLGYAWNKMYSNDLLQSNNFKFEKGLSLVEDIVFNSSVLSVIERIGFLQNPFIHYMQRPVATLGNKFYNNYFDLKKRAMTAVQQLLSVWEVEETTINIVIASMGFEILKTAIRMLSRAACCSREEKAASISKLLSDHTSQEILMKAIAKSCKDKVVIALMKRQKVSLLVKVYQFTNLSIKKGIVSKVTYSKRFTRYMLFFRYLISKPNKDLYKKDENKRKVVVALAADYGNLGDVAITYAQTEFLKKEYPDAEIIDFPISKTFSEIKSLKRIITPNDIITITGGGNTGDMYDDIEYCRQFIIRKFLRNKIVSFPQTIDFSDSAYGRKMLNKAAKVYGQHRNLTLMAREEQSYQKYRQYFYKNKILMVPDIVLSLDEVFPQYVRGGILLCLRNDEEKLVDKLQIEKLVSEKQIIGNDIIYYDTHIHKESLSIDERGFELKKILTAFLKAKLVITDRLHGLIFSVLTQTPCIAFDNSNHKISEMYHSWMKNIRFIKFFQDSNQEDLSGAISEMLSLDTSSISKVYIMDQYEVLSDILNE